MTMETEMFADLHLHTNFSDGTFTPEELAGRGKAHGFTTLALTDHDTVEGCPRMAAACAGQGIGFVPGTELPAELEGMELHVPGQFVDVEDPPLLSELPRSQRGRQAGIRELVM